MGLKNAALRYADRGWPVFPCWRKEPATSRGLKDATTSVRQITRWWDRWPNANVAIRTGGASGLVVIDVDPDHGGDDALHDLEREHGPLPRTASVKTPSGGTHFYFRHPGGEVRNSAGKIGDGLDVRAEGGYVIAPPSRVNDREYVADEHAPIADIPDWLLGLLRERGNGKAHPVSEWRELVRNGVSEGQRNERTAQLAGHLLCRGVDPYVVLELIRAWNTARNQPPLPDAEVARTVDSIAAAETRKRK